MSSLLEYFWWPNPINDVVKEDKKLSNPDFFKSCSCIPIMVLLHPNRI